MTLTVGHYAIWNGGYRPAIVVITAVTDKTVRIKEGTHRERRGDKSQVLAYGKDRAALEKAAERMISAMSEADRRRSAAGQYERDEIARIAKQVMETDDAR